MDSVYAAASDGGGASTVEHVESRLVVAHVDGRLRRAREDFYTIDGRAAAALDHTVVWRWDTGVRKLLLARAQHRASGASAPATCIVQPLQGQWPFSHDGSGARDDGASLVFVRDVPSMAATAAAAPVGDAASAAMSAQFGAEEAWPAQLGMRPSQFEALTVRGFVGLWRPPRDAVGGSSSGGAAGPRDERSEGGNDDDEDAYEVAVLLGRRAAGDGGADAATAASPDGQHDSSAWLAAGLEPLLVSIPGQRRNLTVIDFEAGCATIDERARHYSGAWRARTGDAHPDEPHERRAASGDDSGGGSRGDADALFDVWGWDVDGGDGQCTGLGAAPL